MGNKCRVDFVITQLYFSLITDKESDTLKEAKSLALMYGTRKMGPSSEWKLGMTATGSLVHDDPVFGL